MRRREFITLLGDAATAWPGVARGQQDGRVRVMGWLDAYDRKAITTALREGLAKLGWIEGRNLKIVRRFGAGDAIGCKPLRRSWCLWHRRDPRRRCCTGANVAASNTNDSDRLLRRR